MATLSINFLKDNIKEEATSDFMTAISHETSEMSIELTNKLIDTLNKKIANEKGTYTEEEVSAFKKQLERAQNDKKDFEDTSKDTLEVYEKVISAMSLKNENGFGNNKDVVRTVLRVLGSWDNSKLVKYAIIPAFESPALYEALETIHVTSKAGENGNISMTKAVKEAYKNASDELETIIKTTFSLPVETEYTEKTRVKLTSEDKKLLNDCYIKGFNNKFDVDDESGIVTFKKRNLNKLVKEKKDKKTGKITYDYSGLASTISNIVIKHYFV